MEYSQIFDINYLTHILDTIHSDIEDTKHESDRIKKFKAKLYNTSVEDYTTQRIVELNSEISAITNRITELSVVKPIIIYQGQEIDNDIEHELLDDTNGFDVIIEFTDDAINQGYVNETRYNCTEVHYKYNASNCAFESDIHSTGGTLYISMLNRITINKAMKISEGHHLP